MTQWLIENWNLSQVMETYVIVCLTEEQKNPICLIWQNFNCGRYIFTIFITFLRCRFFLQYLCLYYHLFWKKTRAHVLLIQMNKQSKGCKKGWKAKVWQYLLHQGVTQSIIKRALGDWHFSIVITMNIPIVRCKSQLFNR